MSTGNPTGFCPRCNQQVLLVRKEFDTCLAIVLLLFTGIGFFIYLAVHYGRKEDRCIHCGTEISFSQGQVQYQPSTPITASRETHPITPNYCPLCGEKLDVGIKFCPNCGGKIS